MRNLSLLCASLSFALTSSWSYAADKVGDLDLGKYHLHIDGEFDAVQRGKDPGGVEGITLARRTGLAIQLLDAKDESDDADGKVTDQYAASQRILSKEAGDKAERAETPVEFGGVKGTRVIVHYHDADDGDVVSDSGYVGTEGDYLTWQIDARKQAYDAERVRIDAMLQSITRK